MPISIINSIQFNVSEYTLAIPLQYQVGIILQSNCNHNSYVVLGIVNTEKFVLIHFIPLDLNYPNSNFNKELPNLIVPNHWSITQFSSCSFFFFVKVGPSFFLLML